VFDLPHCDMAVRGKTKLALPPDLRFNDPPDGSPGA
jgi:hypothetical protein